jgi:ubiquinone/menaquinone biosynthesis C-methylase UbiE
MRPSLTPDIHDPGYVAGVFDRCSNGYRRWSSIASFGFIWAWRRSCARSLPGLTGPAPHLLDLMAGTGEIWPHCLAAHPGIHRITAVDISRGMHDHAVERLHKMRSDKISHIQADVLTSTLPDGMADAIVSSFGLKTLSKPQQEVFAGQIARLLKPGGGFALVEAGDPVGWPLRPLYRLYLDSVLPRIERFFLNGAQDFAMLGIYTREFSNISHFAAALAHNGLTVTVKRHFFGCAWQVSGRKPGQYRPEPPKGA